MKFEYEISKKRISFLDTEIYIKNNKSHTKIFRKKTDCQTFLNINSEHPKSLKNSIPYSQAFRIKRICSAKKDFDHHLRVLKEIFLKQGYDQKLNDKQLEKVDKFVRDDLLQEKDQEQQDQQLFAKTGTSSKPTKVYGNYSKKSQSQPLRETKI